jgi:hypothetical protein
MKSRLGPIVLIFAFLVSACWQTDPTLEASTETIPLTATTAVSTETMVAPTTMSSPTQTLTPLPEMVWCIPHQDGVELAESRFEGYPQAIQAFLDDGGTPKMLDEQLYQLGIANQPIAVDFTDLTGDLLYDVVVSIYDPGSLNVGPPGGILLIYVCENGNYQLVYEEISQEGWSAPGIRYLQDLNGDDRAELVIASAVCGAHTCFEEVQVLVWNGREFENRLDGETSDLPFPDVRVIDADGDGVFDLEVTGSGFGSVGAGPPRGVTRIWVFDAESELWMQDIEIPEPSNYRIHLLHDAETATSNEDFSQALNLYDRVINDRTLDDWVDPEQEQATLSAFALYKTGVIHYFMGDERVGQSTFNQLRRSFPSGSFQETYIELANVFEEAYEQGDFQEACIVARDFAEENAALILDPLGPIQFGYASREFTSQDVCPWDG